MRIALAAAALAATAACSEGPAPQPTASGTSDTRSAVGAGQGAAGGMATAASGRLTAKVSSLNASVSGLDTRMSDLGLVIDLPADALFDFDQATLTPAAEKELNKAAELIRRSPAGPIRVVGHTDAKGDDAYNQRLSEARARTVADWFGQQVGVRQRRFEVGGKGETAPVAPNARPDGSDDPAGRTRNRRVEVIVPTA